MNNQPLDGNLVVNQLLEQIKDLSREKAVLKVQNDIYQKQINDLEQQLIASQVLSQVFVEEAN